jgi:hypothetical protein
MEKMRKLVSRGFRGMRGKLAVQVVAKREEGRKWAYTNKVCFLF